jgi:hypothetical protein
MGYIVFFIIVCISWCVIYLIGRNNGIEIGKDQILKENITRVDNSHMTDNVYKQALIEHIQQLLEN